MRSWGPALTLVVFVAICVACKSSSSTDCTCSITQNGEQATVECGQTVCVGNVEFTCTSNQSVSQQDVCAPGTPGPSGAAPAPPSSTGAMVDAAPPTPPDTSCSDLLNYCNSSCAAPPDVSANCLSAASSNDPSECQSWQASNGVQCQP